MNPTITPPVKFFEATECGICLEEYATKESNICVILFCGHIFHELCMNEWTERKQICPSCTAPAYSKMSLAKAINETVKKHKRFHINVIKGPVPKMLAAIAIQMITFASMTEKPIQAHPRDRNRYQGYGNAGYTAIRLTGLYVTVTIVYMLAATVIFMLHIPIVWYKKSGSKNQTYKEINYTPPNKIE